MSEQRPRNHGSQNHRRERKLGRLPPDVARMGEKRGFAWLHAEKPQPKDAEAEGQMAIESQRLFTSPAQVTTLLFTPQVRYDSKETGSPHITSWVCGPQHSNRFGGSSNSITTFLPAKPTSFSS